MNGANGLGHVLTLLKHPFGWLKSLSAEKTQVTSMHATTALSEHLKRLTALTRLLLRAGTNHVGAEQKLDEAASPLEQAESYLKAPTWMSKRQRMLVVLNEMLDALEDLEPAHPAAETKDIVAEMYLSWCHTPTVNLHRSYMFERHLTVRLPGATVSPVCLAPDGTLVRFLGEEKPHFWLVQSGTWYAALPIPETPEAFMPFQPLYTLKGDVLKSAPARLKGIEVVSGVFSSEPVRLNGKGLLHFVRNG